MADPIVQQIELKGEIDLYQSPKIRSLLEEYLSKKPKVLMINLSQVTYMDSSGLATLIEAVQKIKEYNGRLILVAIPRKIKNVFEVARLTDFFEIYDDLSEAMKHVIS